MLPRILPGLELLTLRRKMDQRKEETQGLLEMGRARLMSAVVSWAREGS